MDDTKPKLDSETMAKRWRELQKKIRTSGTAEQIERFKALELKKMAKEGATEAQIAARKAGQEIYKPVDRGGEVLVKAAKAAEGAAEKMPVSKGASFMEKIASLRKAKAAAKLIPGLGALIGIGSAVATGDASAALPAELQPSESGPEQGSLEYKLETGKITPEERKQLMDKYLSKRK